ncbi:arylsulfatase [Crateriforma conspicua]|uniref:Arylsulfatase n=1 Tax=Crateriforma conspicua TaxID=2527996 RepID=A0A5C6FT60_9PLAN|nr:arylsulfatase [Crateriforma conspicua]TWU65551.1 Arylsulfatase [Crateriforma conspicua]
MQILHVRVLCALALVGVLVSPPCLSPTLLAAESSRPNFIVIVCDDMGFSDLGCYGGEIETPNLDRLASSGLRFVDFHNNAKCSETRASLMTGLWHQQSKNLKKPGNVTIAEVLKPAGYRTLMSGKWHLASEPPERGFDRYFGFLGGCINFFTGNDWGSGENLMRLDRNVFDVPDDFYSTDAITDYAIEFLNEGESDDRPFFLYLAHNAPHFPLHAPEEDIAKYRGRYRVGWDEIRRRRYQRLQELGIADETWNLSDRDSKVESWESLTAKEREFLEPMMEVYAAMVDRLDQNIGRLVDHLESTGQLDNTLIFFFSDNGACPYQRLKGDMLVPGSVDSDIAYDARWANMCNTPLRNYKQYAHQGGTLTPMIAHWPNGIQDTGGLNHFPSHLVDIMPTLVELAGATYPTQRNGQDVFPMEGVSLAATLQGKEASRQRKPIYWEFANNHAVRDGNWKLVAERTKDWELYDVSRDRCETDNIIDQYPDVAKRLAESYDQWAKRVGAKTHAKCLNSSPSSQSQLFNLDKLLRDPQ